MTTDIVLITLLSINIAAFALFAIDKCCAIFNCYRISEKVLFFMIIFGGAAGAFLSMQLFRHKTRKKSFVITTYIAIALQVTLAAKYLM